MKTYALTGSASGIGAAIKTHLRNEGHTVISVDIKDADIEVDLSTEPGRDAAISGISALATDGLDGLVACAGVGSHIENLSLIPRVNYFGAVDLVVGLQNKLIESRGAVVLISSNSAPMETDTEYVDYLLAGDEESAVLRTGAMAGQAVYSGSKQALTRWMRRSNAEYANCGVRMNAIGPGYTRTAMSAAVEQDPVYGPAIKEFLATIPMQRAGQPEDMAQAVSFLLSDAASFVSGSILFVDGGHDALFRPDNF